jgi:hypothetical protein
MAGYATAAAKKEEAARLAELFNYAKDPAVQQEVFDRLGQATGQWTPAQGYYGVNVGAQTSRANNAADNERALRTSAMDNQRSAITSLYGALNPGQIAPAVPDEIMGALGLPAIDQRTGAPKPLSETELDAQNKMRLQESGQLTDQMLLDTILGERTPVQAVGADGKPVYMTPGAAVREGAQPAERGPQTVVNMGPNGVDYGEPGKGLVWARNPDNSVKLDERGAPIAIPFQGGEVYQKQMEANQAAAATDEQKTQKNNIVTQDIDRALALIEESPILTTGVGSQLTSGIGSTPAHNVEKLLDTVKANVGFAELQAMRDASPTGGALGQVTEFENRLLQSVLGSLETTQGKDQLVFNLNRLKKVVDGIVNQGITPENVGSILEADSSGAPAAPAPASGGMPDGTIIENDAGQRMIRRNGTWEPYDGR